ncbi:hypothetical protein TU87_02820 [Pseudomonas weihenstephanensis]|nr:hypothetical protein TU87_02820 [Pseudomonas weihenstephanensis]
MAFFIAPSHPPSLCSIPASALLLRHQGHLVFVRQINLYEAYFSPRVPERPDLDVFANVVLLTPKEHHERIVERVPALCDIKAGLASGVTRLPNNCGEVKAQIREFWKIAREEKLGVTLPAQFLWR